ncbi:MAG: carboxymuconolactone decarboxylase family protein [Bryobacteraceae bacterium]
MAEEQLSVEPRVRMLAKEEAGPEAAALYDMLLAQRGVVPNMFRVWAHAPTIMAKVAQLAATMLNDGALRGWYKELIATRISILAECEYARVAHAKLALKKGATPQQVEGLDLLLPDAYSETEHLGLVCADRVFRSAEAVDDEFYALLQARFTEPQIVELVGTATMLMFLTRFINTLRIPITPLPRQE